MRLSQVQSPQTGILVSHFFLRWRHVKQPCCCRVKGFLVRIFAGGSRGESRLPVDNGVLEGLAITVKVAACNAFEMRWKGGEEKMSGT